MSLSFSYKKYQKVAYTSLNDFVIIDRILLVIDDTVYISKLLLKKFPRFLDQLFAQRFSKYIFFQIYIDARLIIFKKTVE